MFFKDLRCAERLVVERVVSLLARIHRESRKRVGQQLVLLSSDSPARAVMVSALFIVQY